MSEPLKIDPLEQEIIDFLPLLVNLGRTADPSVMLLSKLPNTWNFGVLWEKWDQVVKDWDVSQVAHIIKGLTYFEKEFKRGFGSVPPVASLFRVYASLVDRNEQDKLANWVLENTVNDYSPYGTHNHGARSLAELTEKESARFVRKQAAAALEQLRFGHARKQKSLQATERLPNSLRRRYAKAVAALIEKGADPDAVGDSGRSAREIAKELGVESWLSGEGFVEP